MAYYTYKNVRDLLPKHIIEKQGPDYEGEANYDGDMWIAAADYIEELVTERDTLRAQLAEIEKTEPVAWTLTEELDKKETTTRAHLWFTNPVNCMWSPLFTRPMPAQSNAELVEALEKLMEWCEQFRVCGDAGNWDWSDGDEYSKARTALSKYKGAK